MGSVVNQNYGMYSLRHDPEEYAQYTDAPHNPNFGPIDLLSTDALGFQRSQQDAMFPIPTTMGFEPSLYTGPPPFVMNHTNDSASPGLYAEDGEFRLPSSSLSTASAPSSAIGSPQSNSGQNNGHEWGIRGHSAQPGIVGNDYINSAEYTGYGGPMEELAFDFSVPVKGFVDPSLIHPEINSRPSPLGAPHYEAPYHPHTNTHFPVSPSVATSSPQPHGLRTHSSSPPFLPHAHFQPHHAPFPNSPYTAPMDHSGRRPSIGSFISLTSGEYPSGDENKEKQRCTYPDCGKVFKDLKAHMLTHQTERPEKCPIVTCEYHTKGFARKYDKNRHTLTHYKGTMVCGFCPGSGSPLEKSFNRADVFKRHLTAVHAVEQTAPNSRKKSSNSASSGQLHAGYAPDATGKCSTCSQTFSNAQDFYEHLDDCVLRIVQQEDPCEAVNAKRLAEVEHDEDVRKTMELNNLPHNTSTSMEEHDDEDDDDFDMPEVEEKAIGGRRSGLSKKKGNPPNGVQKSKGMTHSRGGVVLSKNKRRRNQDLPEAWGRQQVKHLKKRVLCVFDGPRRLAKDDMMLAADQEVRIKLADGESYVTDLDVQTLKRAEGFLNASEAEKGPWVSDDPTDAQKREMLEIQRQKDAQALKELEESLTVK
ncbi:hypothetical protein N3K66_002242 [Trichothecium roseum]|uniref:Uncharacterized protein n=1 Tax=Trichothecium roseum TaxID=47278 RepID=A0ACC0V916_9HYPO|nr:hypothetical protein N3K66_002242 [Trichothecium roseum]